jgi:succinyl-CoA synthetase alpha subunit
MLECGTQVVAGVTPGKGGQYACSGRVPVFDTVSDAVVASEPDASVVFVPARFAADAIIEAADAGIPLVVCITEGIPVHDMMTVRAVLAARRTCLVGPNSPGILSPGQAKLGIIPHHIAMPGSVGIVSRSGTLTYEVIWALTTQGIGQSVCVGIGGDPVVGTRFTDVLRVLEDDPRTTHVVLIGEIGGSDEERAAGFVGQQMSKPVAAYIAGSSAPPGRRMGHAGAIIEGGVGGASGKSEALKQAGVRVAAHPGQIPELLR